MCAMALSSVHWKQSLRGDFFRLGKMSLSSPTLTQQLGHYEQLDKLCLKMDGMGGVFPSIRNTVSERGKL